jgi:hypothetical protein
MPTLPERVKTKIEQEAPIMGILTGGVYTRPLQRLKTPSAFSPNKINYRPAAYIPDYRTLPHPQGLAIPLAYQGIVTVALYAEAHQGGKDALTEVRQRLIAYLHDWISDSDEGPKIFFRWGGSTPINDSEDFIGAIVCVVTFNTVSRWFDLT